MKDKFSIIFDLRRKKDCMALIVVHKKYLIMKNPCYLAILTNIPLISSF